MQSQNYDGGRVGTEAPVIPRPGAGAGLAAPIACVRVGPTVATNFEVSRRKSVHTVGYFWVAELPAQARPHDVPSMLLHQDRHPKFDCAYYDCPGQ